MVDIYHHGVKGMHWGIRRYQNPDGSLTAEGKERYMYMNRARRAAKTKSDMDNLFNTLSDEDKELLGSNKDDKEWLKLDEGEFVVKRFLKKSGDIPIAALDVMTTTKNGELTIAIMTNPKYRGSGAATDLAKKSIDWFDKNADKYGADRLDWGAYAKNEASQRVAQKAGFVYNMKLSDEDWAVYDHLFKKKED